MDIYSVFQVVVCRLDLDSCGRIYLRIYYTWMDRSHTDTPRIWYFINCKKGFYFYRNGQPTIWCWWGGGGCWWKGLNYSLLPLPSDCEMRFREWNCDKSHHSSWMNAKWVLITTTAEKKRSEKVDDILHSCLQIGGFFNKFSHILFSTRYWLQGSNNAAGSVVQCCSARMGWF